MQDWEFLLQKEGDRSWLPLESPSVEILEGRYRVVAQSRRKNTTVEIRIAHQSNQDDPPKRRLQMRSGQTNDRGLIVVMPYTNLQPGRWELRAQGDLMADMLGQSWQAAVALQVLPQEAEWDWFDAPNSEVAAESIQTAPSQPVAVAIAPPAELQLELPEPEVAAAPAPVVPVAEFAVPSEPEADDREPVSLEAAKQAGRFLRQDLDSIADAAMNDASAPSEPTQAESPQNESASPIELRLVLDQTSFVAHPGEMLRLHGRIESPSISANTSGLTMTVNLRDPQQSKVLAEVKEPLPLQALPLPFECAIEIPNRDQTHLLLGELTIATATGAVLVQQSFTVTIALEQLLAALNDDLPEADWLQLPLQFAEAAPPDLNLALLNLVGAPKPQPQFQTLQPAASAPLPPQLRSESHRAAKPLQLPFADRQSRREAQRERTHTAPASEVEVGIAQRSTPTDAPPASPSVFEAAAPAAPAPEAPKGGEAIDLAADLPSELMMPSDPIRSPLAPPARCEDAAFRSLNLQQRFWSRLNSLASDDERSDWLVDDTLELAGSDKRPSLPQIDAIAAQEVVVEDEYPTRADARRKSHSSESIEPPASMVVPEDELIPVPQITVPQGELTAGATIHLRVKLPNLTPRIYVKLWLCDAQSRSLLEGPRWLVDFIPDGRNHLEAHLTLTVPYGCVELQFEAIAVEMATQRESHKSIALRSVVPPDLSITSVDFDF